MLICVDENVGKQETYFTPGRRGKWNSHSGEQVGSTMWAEGCNYPITHNPTPRLSPRAHSPRAIWDHGKRRSPQCGLWPQTIEPITVSITGVVSKTWQTHALEDAAELTGCTFTSIDKSWKLMLSRNSKPHPTPKKNRVLKYRYEMSYISMTYSKHISVHVYYIWRKRIDPGVGTKEGTTNRN